MRIHESSTGVGVPVNTHSVEQVDLMRQDSRFKNGRAGGTQADGMLTRLQHFGRLEQGVVTREKEHKGQLNQKQQKWKTSASRQDHSGRSVGVQEPVRFAVTEAASGHQPVADQRRVHRAPPREC
jgi:hypothetical protein